MQEVKANPIMLINQLFELGLERDSNIRKEMIQRLVPDMLSQKKFYLLAAPGTSEQDWKNHNFAGYISEGKELLVFLDRADAVRFAIQNSLLMGDEPMVICISYAALAKSVNIYNEKDLVKKVKIYARRPLYLFCQPSYFQQHQKQAPRQELMTAPPIEKDKIQYPDREFKMVEDVKRVLDLSEVSKRRAIDPGLICENLHSVIEKLIYHNKIDMTEMEQQLQLPPGMLRQFCRDRVSSSISKDVAIRLLHYFGLEAYLYQYKRYCNEVMAELNRDETIDRYEIKPANLRTADKYKLVDVRRGKDSRNEAYVYELTFKNKQQEEVSLIVSTPLNYIIGKSYEIIGYALDEQMRETALEKKEKKPIQQDHVPQNRQVRAASFSVEESAGRYRPQKSRPQRTQEEMDHDTIIGYFKEQSGDNFEAAEKKYTVLSKYQDIVHAFAQYIRSNRPGRIKVLDHTAGMLMADYKYSPYEAFEILVQLRDDPKNTKQRLIYRKTNPQYQKKKD